MIVAPAVVSLVLSAVLGAELHGTHVADGILVATAPRLLRELVEQALPLPPQRVVLQTKYYGTVTIDHAAHLARKSPCFRCHGEGPVTKPELTPKLAHERCKGCHTEMERGPTACRDCHVIAPPDAERLKLASLEATATGTETATATPTPVPVDAARPAPAAAAPPSPGVPRVPVAPGTDDPSRRRGATRGFSRALEVGASAGAGTGPLLRLSFRDDGALFTDSVERLASDETSRTFALVGGGGAFPLRGSWDRWEVTAIALAGVDAVDLPLTAFLPAVGAQVGVQYFWRRWMLETVHVAATGMRDLSRRDFGGRRVGGSTFFVTVAMGFRLDGAR